jgi:hypothetical protein
VGDRDLEDGQEELGDGGRQEQSRTGRRRAELDGACVQEDQRERHCRRREEQRDSFGLEGIGKQRWMKSIWNNSTATIAESIEKSIYKEGRPWRSSKRTISTRRCK